MNYVAMVILLLVGLALPLTDTFASGGAPAPGLAAPQVVTVLEFDEQTRILSGELDNGVVADYKLTRTTVFELAPGLALYPAGPCKRLAKKWNGRVRQSAGRGAFDLLLGRMAQQNCRVELQLPSSPSIESPAAPASPMDAIPRVAEIRPTP